MMYRAPSNAEPGWVFIHIPRTSGVALYASLGSCPGVVVREMQERHLPAGIARTALGDEVWERAFRFSIIRNPWEIVASDYRLTRRDVDHVDPTKSTKVWLSRVERMRLDDRFERFLEDEYLGRFSGVGDGGFWKTWCCNAQGDDMGVEAIRYEDLSAPANWQALMNQLGLPRTTVRKHLNEAPEMMVPWTQQSLHVVGALCRDDIARFGYEPPPCRCRPTAS